MHEENRNICFFKETITEHTTAVFKSVKICYGGKGLDFSV